MAAAGLNLVAIAEILDHGDIRTTKRYSHAMEEAKREAVERLAKSGVAGQNGVKNKGGSPRRPPPTRKITKTLNYFGGAEGDRTPDLRIANAALCQTELLPHAKVRFYGRVCA